MQGMTNYEYEQARKQGSIVKLTNNSIAQGFSTVELWLP